MRVVTDNSDDDLAHQNAMADVSHALRELTSNLMRVVRGAGKPDDIFRQTQALAEAFVRYYEATGMAVPADELSTILSIEHDPQLLAQFSGLERDRLDAGQAVIRGALQVAASRLLDQKTQETIGQREMFEGVRAIGRIHDEMRRARTQPSVDHESTRPVVRPQKPRT